MTRTGRRRPTLDDVADAVGVSRATVSNAYNRPDQLSAPLREQVLRAAKELGYPGPNPTARSLATSRTGAIAVLLDTSLSTAFSDPALSVTLDALARVVEPGGHALLLLPGGDPRGGPPAERVLAAQADIAVAYSLADGTPALEAVRERGLPLVVIDQPLLPGTARIGCQDRLGAALAARHLVELGHRRFGIFAAASRVTPGGGLLTPASAAAAAFRDTRERLAGYLEVLGLAEPPGPEATNGVSGAVIREPAGLSTAAGTADTAADLSTAAGTANAAPDLSTATSATDAAADLSTAASTANAAAHLSTATSTANTATDLSTATSTTNTAAHLSTATSTADATTDSGTATSASAMVVDEAPGLGATPGAVVHASLGAAAGPFDAVIDATPSAPAGAFDVVIREAAGLSAESAMAGAFALLGRTPRPTALLCMSDQLALAALAVARQLGIRVPEDLSVVGFDDTSVARWSEPPLTTVRQDLAAKGRIAGELVLNLLAGTPPAVPGEVPVELVVRASTARA